MLGLLFVCLFVLPYCWVNTNQHTTYSIDAVKAVLAKTPKLVDLAPSDAYGAFEVWKSPKNDEYYFHLTVRLFLFALCFGAG